ncbi:MAG: ExeM/NucH family extracellular endonuclease [Nocardioides sp.]|nr:ExeM/NucH family extracellular endonuclease [Nocardioides sp.]
MSLRRRASAFLSLAVAVSGVQILALSSAQAAPSAGLVISEVYGAGGNADASFTNDFIELHNPTAAPISVAGMSVQYRSAMGTTATLTNLSTGSVPARGYYLVQEGSGGAVGAALPAPDASGTINMSGSNGVVILASNQTPVGAVGDFANTGNPANVIDTVGYGTTPTTFEMTNTATALTSSTSPQRVAAGTDSDANNADFTELAPTPTASGVTAPPVEPPVNNGTKTIAEIQGTGSTSPLTGTVTTSGVVTAAYPTGGLNGFYLQTGGSGAASDATPGASDALFVYGGPTGFTTYPKVGDSVQVTGSIGEFSGSTQLTVLQTDLASLTPALAPVTAQLVIPGADCVIGGCLTGADLDALREPHEGERYQPTAAYTVTDAYDGSPAPSTSGSFFGEIGLAAHSTGPLLAPTEVVDAQDAAGIAERTAFNKAHRIILNDGSSTNYTTTTGSPFPWFTKTHTVRAGAAVTFPQAVVLGYGNNTWKLEPRTQIVGKPVTTAPSGSTVVATGPTFAQDRPLAPTNVGGDLKLATFNVLNYFTTLGANLPGCTSFKDRAGIPVTVNSCPGSGPRGAWDATNLKRQQDKIVNAMNTMDADIVSLEEIENSLSVDGPSADRDEALATLVAALNADAGYTRWDYARSPVALPTSEDVIRTAFIYDPNTVARVGASKILIGSAAFTNARQPLAQAFKARGAADSTAFAVVVNHFKSKGSGGTGDNADAGQGFYNGDRTRQAQALSTFADTFAADRGIDRIFLTGDFNSYSMEDPIQELVTAGYRNLSSTTQPGEKSYNFGGLAGSLDHVFFKSRSAAPSPVTGVDIWTINADESVYYEYSRFNDNATDLYDASPFRASDHSPEIVGITTGAVSTTQKVQVLATNDFHGRIAKDPFSSAAGAGVLAGAVNQFRAANPDTVFAAAGDLIGASTFESFIDQDKPTIDALNSAGLDVSSVGNHEFDQGYDDLVNRVMAPESQANPKGGAAWQYIGANIRKKVDNSHALVPRWTETFGEVKVGFVGAVTEHLPELVSPDGIADITVTDIVTEANLQADLLRSNGADIIVLLVHEGAPSTAYADAVDPANDFGRIVTGINAEFDAVVSGHTHLAYNHAVPVPSWIDEGRTVTKRPVVSAGQYGSNLNQLVFTYDEKRDEVLGVRQKIVALKTTVVEGSTTTYTENFPTDAATQAIANTAVANAEVLGAQPLGQIGGAFKRAALANGTTENRGGESTLGNLVAEIQRFATRNPESGAAQIAFMNPGGLRADLNGDGTGAFPRTVTVRQAANVQPFANTLVNMDLTGAQIKATLEQQWQAAGAARPFLKLGISRGFSYTYDASEPQGTRVSAMYLNGLPIGLTSVYSVTVNSFLSSGGDGFTALAGGTGKQDTGKTDLQSQVDYFDAQDGVPVPVDSTQRAVGARFPAGAPASYTGGETVSFDLTSLSMSGAGDLTDAEVQVRSGDTVLGTFPVTTTIQAALPGFDEVGTASVSVVLPAGTPAGTATLVVTGTTTGTSVPVAVAVRGASTAPPTTPPTTPPTAPPAAAVSTDTKADVKPHKVVVDKTKARVKIEVEAANGATVAGLVAVKLKGEKAETVMLENGKTTITLDRFQRIGKKKVLVTFLANAAFSGSEDEVTFMVERR